MTMAIIGHAQLRTGALLPTSLMPRSIWSLEGVFELKQHPKRQKEDGDRTSKDDYDA